jgi:uncharacterized membrane protein
MTIEWNKVTWYSTLLALIVFVVTVSGGFYYGIQYQKSVMDLQNNQMQITAEGMHCGGFIKNAPTCPAGYHCQLQKIADLGGSCVKD